MNKKYEKVYAYIIINNFDVVKKTCQMYKDYIKFVVYLNGMF